MNCVDTVPANSLLEHTLNDFLRFVKRRQLDESTYQRVVAALAADRNARYLRGIDNHRGYTLRAAVMHQYPVLSQWSGEIALFHLHLGLEALHTLTNVQGIPSQVLRTRSRQCQHWRDAE